MAGRIGVSTPKPLANDASRRPWRDQRRTTNWSGMAIDADGGRAGLCWRERAYRRMVGADATLAASRSWPTVPLGRGGVPIAATDVAVCWLVADPVADVADLVPDPAAAPPALP